MTLNINSTKMSEVSAALATLTGSRVSVWEIVQAILQISNFQEKTLNRIQKSKSYVGDDGVHLSKIFADMDYQRRIRLRKLINKLIELSCFNMDVAGSMDIAERPNGDCYVWDGLRRMIMAGITGMESVRVNKLVHPRVRTPTECKEHEAYLLEVRNTKLEGMKPEEIFKAQVCRKVPAAIELLDVLKNCSLDVEGIVGRGTLLGGFSELNNNFKQGHQLKEKHLIDSSDICRTAFNNPQQVSVFLFTGLAYLLQYMDDKADEIDKTYEAEDIKDMMIDYAKIVTGVNANGVDITPTQKDLISPRINGKTCQSVAWIITTNVINDKNGLRNLLQEELDDQRGILVNGDDDDEQYIYTKTE